MTTATPLYPPPFIHSSLLEKTGGEAQDFSIAGGKSTVVVGKSGIRFVFPAFSCQKNDGSTYTGEIRLELTELARKGEMIAAGMSNAAENHLHESILVFHLGLLTTEGESLRLQVPIEVAIPVDESRVNPLAFQLYSAGQSSIQSFTTASILPDWRRAGTGKLILRRMNGHTYLQGLADHAGWWSCSTPLALKGKQHMISAKCCFPHRFETGHVSAFLTFQRANTVLRMHEGNRHFSSFNVPLKMPASILAFGQVGDKTYFCESPLNANQVFYYLYMQETDIPTLAEYLNKL